MNRNPLCRVRMALSKQRLIVKNKLSQKTQYSVYILPKHEQFDRKDMKHPFYLDEALVTLFYVL